MPEQKTPGETAALQAEVAEIFSRALSETLTRLTNITAEEREDNRAFDRAARTALALLRVAEGAAGLAARKRKEQIDHDQTGADAEEEERINKDEAVLRALLNKYIDGLASGEAESARQRDVDDDSQSAGDNA